jgi:hypothetical protein
VCQQTGPTQAIPAEALTAEKAKMPAPITAPARDLLSAVIFNPPFMLFNVKLTAQLDIGSSNIFNKGILGVWSKQNKTKKTGRTGGMQPAIRRRNRSV